MRLADILIIAVVLGVLAFLKESQDRREARRFEERRKAGLV
jgi:hypothetical protein